MIVELYTADETHEARTDAKSIKRIPHGESQEVRSKGCGANVDFDRLYLHSYNKARGWHGYVFWG